MQKKRTPFYTARIALKISQGEAARRSGVAQQTISELEIGHQVNPSWDILSRLSQIYGVRPEQLLPHSKLPKRDLKPVKRERPSARIIAAPFYPADAHASAV